VTADFGEASAPRVMIRADMDALPLSEDTGVSFASETAERMHACGHDGHVAIGVAVAERLRRREEHGAAWRSLFQPAEEGAGGARAMVEDGALDGIAATVGLHLWNPLPVGKIGLVAGPQMAAVDEFEIVVRVPAATARRSRDVRPGAGLGAPDRCPAGDRLARDFAARLGRRHRRLHPRRLGLQRHSEGGPVDPGTPGPFRGSAPHAAGKIDRVARGVADRVRRRIDVVYRRINETTVNDPP
jgi:hypothetical protein